MRRRGRQSARDYSREVVLEEINKAMVNRRKLLSPFPLDPMEVYQAIIPPEIHAAMKVMSDWNDSALERNSSLDIRWQRNRPRVANPFHSLTQGPAAHEILKEFTGAEYRATLVSITLPYTDYADRPFLPDAQNFHGDSLPHAMREVLEPWAQSYIKCKLEELAIRQLTNAIFRHCNTMGQVKRAWPNLMNFMPTEARQKVEAMVKQSKLPDGFQYMQVEGEVFSEKNIEAYDAIITEALILPKIDSAFVAELGYERC